MSRDDPIRGRGRPPASKSWPWDEVADGELIARFKGGEKVKVIARAMGRPYYVVSGRIERLRDRGLLPYRNKGWSAREDADLLAATASDRPRYSPLARLFGRSRQALRQRALQLRREAAEAAARADADQYRLELS